MPATVETTPSDQDAGPGSGAFASSPLLIIVFGFVLLILLQAWFVRRITQLTARHQERKVSYRKLGAEVAELTEEVTGLDRASESNVASVAALERETQELQGRIDAFVAEHGDKVMVPAAAESESTDEEGNAESGAAESATADEGP